MTIVLVYDLKRKVSELTNLAHLETQDKRELNVYGGGQSQMMHIKSISMNV